MRLGQGGQQKSQHSSPSEKPFILGPGSGIGAAGPAAGGPAGWLAGWGGEGAGGRSASAEAGGGAGRGGASGRVSGGPAARARRERPGPARGTQSPRRQPCRLLRAALRARAAPLRSARQPPLPGCGGARRGHLRPEARVPVRALGLRAARPARGAGTCCPGARPRAGPAPAWPRATRRAALHVGQLSGCPGAKESPRCLPFLIPSFCPVWGSWDSTEKKIHGGKRIGMSPKYPLLATALLSERRNQYWWRRIGRPPCISVAGRCVCRGCNGVTFPGPWLHF